IARLLGSGIHGSIDALWPPYWSATAWAAILTGHPRDEVGVYADVLVEAPGLPLFGAPLDGNVLLDPYFLVEWKLLSWNLIEANHPPRNALGRPPVWEMLARAGVDAGVIRFDFTYPADRQAAFVVSNRVGNDEWQVVGARGGDGPGVVAPETMRAQLLAPFSHDVPFDEALFATMLPGPHRPHSPHVAVHVRMLLLAMDVPRRTLRA